MATGTPFVRHRLGEERRSPIDRFSVAESDDHYGSCWECMEPIDAGQRVTLFAVGPVDVDEAVKADAGQWYTAVAVVGHQTCLWPEMS